MMWPSNTSGKYVCREHFKPKSFVKSTGGIWVCWSPWFKTKLNTQSSQMWCLSLFWCVHALKSVALKKSYQLVENVHSIYLTRSLCRVEFLTACYYLWQNCSSRMFSIYIFFKKRRCNPFPLFPKFGVSVLFFF